VRRSDAARRLKNSSRVPRTNCPKRVQLLGTAKVRGGEPLLLQGGDYVRCLWRLPLEPGHRARCRTRGFSFRTSRHGLYARAEGDDVFVRGQHPTGIGYAPADPTMAKQPRSQPGLPMTLGNMRSFGLARGPSSGARARVFAGACGATRQTGLFVDPTRSAKGIPPCVPSGQERYS
jgi:hypothetical protein